MIGRFLRINRLKKNVYIDLITASKDQSLDEAVLESLENKANFDLAIYAGKRS